MTPLAVVFMTLSWSFVLGLTAWCFRRVLRASGGGSPKKGEPTAGAGH